MPVVPVFITFEETEETKKSPLGIPRFVVNILKPIYADKTLSPKENIGHMKKTCENEWWQTYENFYHKKREQN